ncbi:CHASE domain-containing protein [Parerythrobacter aestuarii]|uniref:CHASE domain-containing protein n=1 Tax=Parerythrobacter aestuarii TaxID=3020909 RepID=UPI0024DE7A1B|nr:CHASE domain-containing protein [Parerythrobacter aestuarii]
MKYPRAVPLAIFLLIAGVTALSVFAIERGDNRRELAQIDQTARTIGSTLERRANNSTAYLRAGAALFSTVDTVQIDLFQRFARELKLDDQYRVSGGIGWAEVLEPNEVGQFESRIGSQLGRPISVYRLPGTEAAEKVVPVTFSLPDSVRTQRALGLDMYAEPVRRTAMNKAVTSLEPTATQKITLVSGRSGPRPGLLVYMPVFSAEQDGRQLKGFLYSPFDGQNFLDGAIYDGLVGDRSVRLYDGAIDQSNLLATHQDSNGIGQSSAIEILIGNRAMMLEVQSAKGSTLTPLSMITLLFGLAVASLSMLIARLLTQQALEDLSALEYYTEQNSIRNSLTRELNHRVKNTLANVLSIIALTRRRTDNLDDFATALDGRIRALSATHDLLTQSEWGSTPLRSVIEAELAPYANPEDRALDLEGPDLALAPNDALSFGLAIHELATNAAKYGALSAEGGRVIVSWERQEGGIAEVRWREEGGPPVPQERSRGFGTDLIEKIVAHELRHPVELEFPEDGVRCTLRVPIRKPSEFAIRAQR